MVCPTVVCINVGTKYDPIYVEKLYSMVERNTTLPHDFLCLTDNQANYSGIPTAQIEEDLPGWWSKLTLFRKRAYGLKRILFLDVDVVITGNIDGFLTYEGDFAIIRDWNYPAFNSSVFNLNIGSQAKVWTKFIKNKDRIMKNHHGDQDWITKHSCPDLWPIPWCTSFKSNPYPSGKISIFHGKPDPHEAAENIDWVKEMWR